MTPETLAKNGTEHGHQRALFAWLNMAALFGFAAADDDRSYTVQGHAATTYGVFTQQPLCQWAFAIPNGGKRDKITAGKLKAEGVKPGVPDVLLPAPVYAPDPAPLRSVSLKCGLFIEMKRPKSTDKRQGVVSKKQEPWHAYLTGAGYAVVTCMNWREAADAVKAYLTGDHQRFNE